uniref:Uncharacterized protein n=1 Tax=Steinernema glaseri TaxID=37863 RepID=A0A1I7YY86_9BILA
MDPLADLTDDACEGPNKAVTYPQPGAHIIARSSRDGSSLPISSISLSACGYGRFRENDGSSSQNAGKGLRKHKQPAGRKAMATRATVLESVKIAFFQTERTPRGLARWELPSGSNLAPRGPRIEYKEEKDNKERKSQEAISNLNNPKVHLRAKTTNYSRQDPHNRGRKEARIMRVYVYIFYSIASGALSRNNIVPGPHYATLHTSDVYDTGISPTPSD